MDSLAGHWVLGLDAGTDSLGWAAFRLDGAERPDQLLDGGVRLFDGGRDPVKKDSLAKERGVHRRTRRRLRARKWRRDRLSDLLAASGLTPPNQPGTNAWTLRAAASRSPVGPQDLAVALLHMARHRGFKSGSLAAQAKEDREAAEELGRWERSAESLRARMAAEGVETVGQLFALALERGEPVRARRGVGDAPTRDLVREEFRRIREAQRDSIPLSAAQWDAIQDLIFDQRPLGEPSVGRCSVPPHQDFRLPKAMPSAQRFLVRQTLANLRIDLGDYAEPRALNSEEHAMLADLLDAGGVRTWSSLRKAIGLPRRAKFTIEREVRPGQPKRSARETEGDQTAALLRPLVPAWNALTLEGRDALVGRLLGCRRDRRALLRIGAELQLEEAQREALADAVQFQLPRGHLAWGATVVSALLRHLVPGTPTHLAFERALGRSHSDRRPDTLSAELGYYGALLPQRVRGGTGDPRDPDEKRYGVFGNVTVHVALNEMRRWSTR